MIRQWIYLPEWDWVVIVFYNATPIDKVEIYSTLYDMGVSEETIIKIDNNIKGDMLNTGLTYTNVMQGISVIVISNTSSPSEFWSTLDHEKGHAGQHIAQALGFPCNGEEQQYIVGELAKEMYSIAKEFI